MKSIFQPGSTPTPVGKFTTSQTEPYSPMVRAHPSHVSFNVSISAPTELGPRENGFPRAPLHAAVDGPGWR